MKIKFTGFVIAMKVLFVNVDIVCDFVVGATGNQFGACDA